MSRAHWLVRLLIPLLAPALLVLPSSATAQIVDPCEGPAGDPEPGTAAFAARDALNMFCAEERKIDMVAHPVTFPQPIPGPGQDAYRDPLRLDNVRFRFDAISIGNLATEVYLPCSNEPDVCPDLPEHLERFDPPYPVVLAIAWRF